MHRTSPLRGSWWLALALLLTSSSAALAGEKVDELIRQLKGSDDFRVRTQAALALGVSKESVAMQPLCDALEDKHEAVRGASAAALGKLGQLGGISCLKEREPKESNSTVKTAIAKSIKALEAIAKVGDKASIPANAKWYVSLGKVNNKTTRTNSDLDLVIHRAFSDKLRTMDGYAMAPRGETPKDAKNVIKAKKLKGFEFQITVEPPTYEGGKILIALRVMITSYPGKDIKAVSSPKISQDGVHKQDKAMEDQLLKLLIEDAIEKFDKSVASM